MKLHFRERTAGIAQSEFGWLWNRTLSNLGIDSFADAYLILNRLDRYWVEAFRSETPPADAAAAWKDADLSDFENTEAVRQIGDALAKIVVDSELTYGEISSVFGHVRLSDAKSHICVERHPDAPDTPGGISP